MPNQDIRAFMSKWLGNEQSLENAAHHRQMLSESAERMIRRSRELDFGPDYRLTWNDALLFDERRRAGGGNGGLPLFKRQEELIVVLIDRITRLEGQISALQEKSERSES